MRNIILSVILGSLSLSLTAQLASPVLRCASVNADGSVSLTWEEVSDPAGIFTAYSVYYRPDPAAPFSLAGQVSDISQVTYTHLAAAANNRSRYYYILAGSSQGPSEPSDTLETIFLYFETNDNEHITLYWNALHDPPLPTPNVSYILRMEYPPGEFQELANTQSLEFDYQFWFCNQGQNTVNFQVLTQDISVGCQSSSNIPGAVLSNLSQPDIPIVDSASITGGGQAVLGWQAATAPDISGYIIYRVTDINDSIAFIPGIDSTFFIDFEAEPCEGPVRYAIASVDSCGNKSPGTFLNPHRTLYLREIVYDPCLLENRISWTPYQNFLPALGGYELFVSNDNGPFTLLASSGPGDTAYLHTQLASNTLYTYYVRAVSADAGKTSTSCRQEVQTFNSPVPQFMYLRYASVGDDRSVELSFFTDTNAHVRGYKVFRSEDMSSFLEIGAVDPSGSEVLFFTDSQAETWQKSYYYQVSVIDSCNNESVIANTSRTILLEVRSKDDLTVDLSWNAYEHWDADVAGYRVYRRVEGESMPLQVGETQPGELGYSDDISDLTGTNGRISYFVEAFEGNGNQYGFSDVARSNEVLADVIEKVFVPNAFAPAGLNNSFRPVGNFISDAGYLFSIYNRWGQLVFESRQPSEAWDGKLNGSYVEQGVYVYILRFTTSTGEVILRKGAVAVIF